MWKENDYDQRNYGRYSRPRSPEDAKYPSVRSMYENFRLSVSLPRVSLPMTNEERAAIANFAGAEIFGSADSHNPIAAFDGRVFTFDLPRRGAKSASVSVIIDIHETQMSKVGSGVLDSDKLILRWRSPIFGFETVELPASDWAEKLAELQIACELRRSSIFGR